MKLENVKFQECGNGVIRATTAKNCRYDAIDKINKKFIATSTSNIVIDFGHYCNDNPYLMKDNYTAIARCGEGDEYDVEIGKRIALKRLSEKYNSALNKRIARFLTDMDKSLKSMDKYFEGRTF